jgi:hypothetical protein
MYDGSMMDTARIAMRILDEVSDMRLKTMDMDHVGFHLINLSPLGLRDQLVIMADAIKYHNETLPGSSDGQYALF